MATNTSTQKLVNELEKAVDSSRKLLKVFEETEEVTKDIAKELQDAFKGIDKKTSKGITEFNKALKETNKLVEDSEKLQSAKLKTEDDLLKKEKQLSTARIQETKEKQELHKLEQLRNKTQIQVQKERERRLKLLKKESVASKKELDAYQKKSKALNEARKQFKALAAEQKGTTKEAKILLKSITELDEELKEIDATVGQNQRSVGKYKDAVKGLNSTIGKLGATALIVKGVELLTNAFGNSRDGALLMETAMNTLTGTISVTIGRLTTAAGTIRKLFDEAKGWTGQISAFGSSIGVLLNGFDGIGEQVSETIKDLNVVSKLTQDYNIQIQALERSISSLNKAQVIQTQIAENDTLSFQIRIEASKEAVRLAIELGDLQEEKARKELDLQNKVIVTQLKAKAVSDETAKTLAKEQAIREGIAFDESKFLDDATINRLKALDITKTTEVEIQKLLKNRIIAGKIGGDVEQAFTDSFVANQDVQLESVERLSDVLEKQNILYNDRAQAILDIQVDALDNQKTINERIIADDKETFDERKETLDRTKVLFEDGYKAQKKTLIDLNNTIIDSERKKINSNDLLTDSQKKTQTAELERQKSVLTGAEIDKIVAEEDAVIQAEKILALELNEKTIIDLLAVLRDYRTGQQDLKDDEKDYNDTLSEQTDLKNKIAIQQRQLNKEIFDIEQEQRDKRIVQLKEEISLIEKETLQKLKLQEELNKLLLENQTITDNTLEENAKKSVETRKKLVKDGVTVIDSILSKARDKQKSELEAELDALDSRIDSVRNAIENGNSEASESLAELEKQKEQAEKRQEDIRKKEIRDQKIIAGLQLLSANDGNVGKTLGDVSTLIAGLSQLDSFFDGVEDTGTVANPLDSNGGRMAILHDNERILTAKQNAKIGGLSNEDLASVAQMHNSGSLGGTTVLQSNNDNLVREVTKVVKAIESQPVQSYNYDAKRSYHEQILVSKNKREVVKVKVNNLYK